MILGGNRAGTVPQRDDDPRVPSPVRAPQTPAAAALQARLRMAIQAWSVQRRTFHVETRERMSRALWLAALAFCILFAIAFLLTPLQEKMLVKVDLPTSERTIVLPEIEPPAETARQAIEKVAVHEDAAPAVQPEPEPLPPVLPHDRRVNVAPVDPDAGRAGRARAREATAKLAAATSALDRALGDVSSALKSSTGAYEPVRGRRDRTVRGGRSDGELGSVATGNAGQGAAADLKGSLQGVQVAIGALAPGRPSQSDEAGDPRTGGSAPSAYRSNASLLAVIQRYAAGIQYCYGNELKHDPTLRGKLVVSITIAPSGQVLEANAVQNTVGSQALAACALSQIRDWKFPAIAAGVTTFQAPFVFTPPN